MKYFGKMVLAASFGTVGLVIVDRVLGIKIEPWWKDYIRLVADAAYGILMWEVIRNTPK